LLPPVAVTCSTGPAEHLPSILKTGLDESAVRTLAEKLRVATNDLLALINALLTGNDWLLTGKAVAALWVIGWIGRVITPMGLLYTGAQILWVSCVLMVCRF
jgi:hypothetical protein